MFNRNQDNDELEQSLAELEKGATGKMLATAAGQIAPRAEFVNELERKMRGFAPAAPKRASWQGRPLRLVSAGLALVLLVVAVLWLKQPETVSAHEILARAAAAQLPSNGFAHMVYTIEGLTPTQRGGSAEVWLGADADGNIARTALSMTFLNQDGSAHEILRMVIVGDAVQIYDYNPAANTVRLDKGKYEQVIGDSPNHFDGKSVAKALEKIAAGNEHGVELLPPQSFYDKPVYVVQMQDNGETTIFYFDAQTYVLRGYVTTQTRAHLTQEEIVPAAQVKSDAFDFNPPVFAREVTNGPFDSQYSTDLSISQGVFVSACHLTGAEQYVAAARGKTPLALCQEQDPTVTEDALVGTLMSPMKEKFDAVVKAGNMTLAQETESLKNLQTKLREWMNSPYQP